MDMPLPPSWSLITVTGSYLERDDGSPATGTVIFSSPRTVVIEGQTVVPRHVVVPLVDGGFSVGLPATTDPDINPTGWRWLVTERVAGLGRKPFWMDVDAVADAGGIDLDERAPLSYGSDGVPVVVGKFVEHTHPYLPLGDVTDIQVMPFSEYQALPSTVPGTLYLTFGG